MKNPTATLSTRKQAGFSLIEVMLAMVILAVGMLALLGLFAQAVGSTQFAQENLIAKQKARETLEAIYSARNDTALNYDAINNVPAGIFRNGFQPLLVPGPNGIPGTAQDTANFETVTLPGPDGRLATGDDIVTPLTNYQRQIAIIPVMDAGGNPLPNLREITITVRVFADRQRTRDYVVTGYISRFR